MRHLSPLLLQDTAVIQGARGAIGMPVPLSVTHKNAKGLTAAVAAELPTEGPFARLQAQPAGDGGGAQPAAGSSAQPEPEAAAASAEDVAVATSHLSFSYPDIGALFDAAAHVSTPLAPTKCLRPALLITPTDPSPSPPAPQTAARCRAGRRWCRT